MMACARGLGEGAQNPAISFKPDCKHSSHSRSPSTKIASGSCPSRTWRACLSCGLTGLVMSMANAAKRFESEAVAAFPNLDHGGKQRVFKLNRSVSEREARGEHGAQLAEDAVA